MIGTALDMRAAGNAFVSVSVNGSFAPPISVAFSGITAPHLSPASSSFDLHLVNFGHHLFAHAATGAEFVLVHEFGRSASVTTVDWCLRISGMFARVGDRFKHTLDTLTRTWNSEYCVALLAENVDVLGMCRHVITFGFIRCRGHRLRQRQPKKANQHLLSSVQRALTNC